MAHDQTTQPDAAPAASSATGGQVGGQHWQHREASAPAVDPVQYKKWCDDRLVQLMAEPLQRAPRAGASTQLAPSDGHVAPAPAGGDTSADVHASAQRGVAGPGQPLPHLDAIQSSFGPGHDVSHVQAHVGGAAAAASGEMGARAYATGDHVAFAAQPDLHLAAHEAAHTVQQRAGVQLSGGVGAEGDAYERNADAVADRVVAGKSAADLLPGGAGAVGGAVQHKAGHHEAHAGPHHPGPHADDGDHDDADEDHGHEADEEESAASASVNLAPGKPPGAVQKKAAAGAPAHAARRRARALTIEEATARYAPLVFLAPGETDKPSDASQYIKNSRLRWSHDSGRSDHQIADQGKVDEDKLGSGGYSHQTEGVFGGHGGDPIHSNDDSRPKDGEGRGGDEGFFLDLDNSKHKSLGSTNAPVYFEAVNHRYITFWFFYAYNSGPVRGGIDNHEGDWERIVVKLDSRNRATRVAYYQHEGHVEKSWKDAPKQGTHPLVYSAKGSHASYDSPGAKSIPLPVVPDVVKDHAGKGEQWKTWQHLKNAKQQDWYGYGGAWGEVGNTEISTGPQGPSKHKAAAPKGW